MSASPKEMANASARPGAEAIKPYSDFRKIFEQGSRDDPKVGMREITLTDTPTSFGSESNSPVTVCDTSGQSADPDITIDLLACLPPTRKAWINVREGIVTNRIAAHAADLARSSLVAQIIDNALSKARFDFLWEDRFNFSLDPDKARSLHNETLPKNAHKVAHFCSTLGPNSCSIKITQDIRDYAATKGLGDVSEANTKGMKEKAREFIEQGGEVYSKA